MEYYIGFFAGMLATLAICLAVIKYNEIKQEKEVEKPNDTPVKLTVRNVNPIPITVEHIATKAEVFMSHPEVIKEKVSRRLAAEILKYAEMVTEENPMDFTVRIRARVWVVEGWGGFM